MTATPDGGPKIREKSEPTAEQRAAEEMVVWAREQGLSLTGPGGSLKQLTKADCAEPGAGPASEPRQLPELDDLRPYPLTHVNWIPSAYSALGLLSLWTRVAQRDDC